MRIRSIKPEFWRSDDIAALPISARLLFIGLWSYVDDNGVGSDKVSSIAADLFAADLEVDPTETFRRVSVDTACLSERGLIHRYIAKGRPLLYITNWERHQIVKNPSKGHQYPLPSADSSISADILRRPSVEPPQTLGTGAGEQGSRGTGEQGKKPTHAVEKSHDCNVREFTESEMSDAGEILSRIAGAPLGELEVSVAVDLIVEASTEPVEDLAAYLNASVESSPGRVAGLCREASRQVQRVTQQR